VTNSSPTGIVSLWWQRFDRADFAGAIGLMTHDAIIDWPLSGERIIDPVRWKSIQEHYPGNWTTETTLTMHDSARVFTITDGRSETETDLALSIFTVIYGVITNLIQYWPATYSPAMWRSTWVERIPS
jgi:hypothetical protein